ncbi:UAA transporter [Fistulina hepatica ATCC 64428]|uniref:UAA transporter n=1 Tax=Fistulina hepatica ATCC 64428 TaxID=1128425 RepID=A0A0D7A1T1_9AGAR|nr:UAA transporter [Fistulina hepatica ATCC 64428]
MSTIIQWFTTLSLVFGGCCSNAVTLEQLTSEYPQAGSLITLFQFVLISLNGLRKNVIWTSHGPRFRTRRIPLTRYIVMVALHYTISLLNNAAFAYHIPMAVHVIFRSSGLVISMLLGWITSGKKYNVAQVLSVVVVSVGVALTTFSASPSHVASAEAVDARTYALGIGILLLALFLAGFLGLAQERTYFRYAHGGDPNVPIWQESMFYLHFMALPMFYSVRADLSAQIRALNAAAPLSLSISLPHVIPPTMTIGPGLLPFKVFVTSRQPVFWLKLPIPAPYVPLVLNTATQLICSMGVNKLTTTVSSLTVTLILVVRKAVSLILSVMGFGNSRGPVDIVMLLSGAGLVMLGTVGYAFGSSLSKREATRRKRD